MLARYEGAGLLTVAWAWHETTRTQDVGRGRGGPDSPTRTEVPVRDVIREVQRNATAPAAQQQRLGWQVQITNAPVDRRSLLDTVTHYRRT